MSYILDEIIQKRSDLPNYSSNDFPGEYEAFYSLCFRVKKAFADDWENRTDSSVTLEIQKKAIIGYEKEKDFFKSKIDDLIRSFDSVNTAFPHWYESLVDAVYHENWGLAGLAEWFNSSYMDSSSAKIIGERIYFMDNGRMNLRPQRITAERRDQLIKAFLLLTPEERMDKDYYETYLLDGTRVTIFVEPMAKAGQACLIFRRYIIPTLNFEEQARRGTIPRDIIPLFKVMVKIGFNVVFMGAVRTAKTTFLSTWQSYEDPTLEGVMVETDPEIPLHKLLPGAPVMQLIADGQVLSSISKNLLRSDADYFILAEARDGIALDTAVRIASKGTKRMKMTFHGREAERFPLEAATEIVKSVGGDINLTMQRVAAGFDYIFHFVQLTDKSQKRLEGIYELNVDNMGKVSVNNICKYDFEKNEWHYSYIISDSHKSYAIESDIKLFKSFDSMLKSRAKECGHVD